MAILADARTSRLSTLTNRCIVGRSSVCQIRVDDARVSGEHACFSWTNERWEVRDLGSRNGTFVKGQRLDPGGSSPIAAGDLIAFGSNALTFSLLDASPPVAQARHLTTGQILFAVDGLLALPSDEDPGASVYQDTDGRWIVEIDGEVRAASDGEVLKVHGEAYALHLPTSIEPTVEVRSEPSILRDVELSFRVSLNEENIELVVKNRGRVHVMPPRAYHYTLLTLARARLRDEEEGALPVSSRGWILVDALCRMLATDENRLNVEVFRIRRDFGAIGFENAAGIVERQRGSRQLRVGTPRVVLRSFP